MLQAFVGNGWAGDIAIDDINFDTQPCVNSSLPQQMSSSSESSTNKNHPLIPLNLHAKNIPFAIEYMYMCYNENPPLFS